MLAYSEEITKLWDKSNNGEKLTKDDKCRLQLLLIQALEDVSRAIQVDYIFIEDIE